MGQGQDGCHLKRVVDEMSILVVAADGGGVRGRAGSKGSWGSGSLQNLLYSAEIFQDDTLIHCSLAHLHSDSLQSH